MLALFLRCLDSLLRQSYPRRGQSHAVNFYTFAERIEIPFGLPSS